MPHDVTINGLLAMFMLQTFSLIRNVYNRRQDMADRKAAREELQQRQDLILRNQAVIASNVESLAKESKTNGG